ncbi:peptide-methionine (S)-S-oxide reductase MsrA [Candidatus Thiodictyon syntrophicum]|jgi:peptide-methionine (S)-S-oxide reductase|uniref:Peptide methionine sulfoxide reductase MsrA n=1 Tax=Candidatus Thiodictyon syntrophicum TaxID=1166950 RepID=A0A2K8UFY8_9GAMM|nr:peptide-methionine (S)-S-oxide reductase MsrA [Candidatus Thiodictyon syntrophicum]AUB84465.1 peptide-methionine (S)-S-oxide reductase [Candidatus Thiodictyon syntrophicum]
MASETATLGGGCFWCVEAAFLDLKGVTAVVSGYAGGPQPNPTYKQVCTGSTGHAEVVQVTFDNAAIDYRTILEVFFTVHDPTTLNAQGADVGTQYRSVIYWHTDAQRETALAVIAQLTRDGVWPNPIVTEVAPLPTFYPAEDYHQDYYRRNPYQGYCQAVISPKLGKLRQKHRELLVA